MGGGYIAASSLEQLSSSGTNPAQSGRSSRLRREINSHNAQLTLRLLTLAQLVEHYKQRELALDNTWKTYSTKATYRGYLRKWIVPRWGTYTLASIRPIEVERWLRNLAALKSQLRQDPERYECAFQSREKIRPL